MKFHTHPSTALLLFVSISAIATASPPHIVLVMADDMGWGQTGYYNHPVLKTPNLDDMASHGLRFDRFYAGAPNCSPTRASILTGRTNDRTGVFNHGHQLRSQERTLPKALRAAGYATAHFGKWHLSGLRGAGAPVLAEDDHNPGAFGFDEWLSATNYIDRDPLLGRMGVIEKFKGDSSEVIVAEALKFIGREAPRKPTFTVIWYGSPHNPFVADAEDTAAFASLDEKSRNHYGELVAMDRSIGALRAGLRKLGIADSTLVIFNSDNGGLPNISPGTVGGLRDFKNSVYEGGLRVPAIIEWPARIKAPRVTRFPACTMDLFPTISEIVGLPADAMGMPVDGISLVGLFAGDIGPRTKPIGFRHTGRAAMIDNRYKIVTQEIPKGPFEIYDLESDPAESRDIAMENPDVAARLKAALLKWNASVEASVAGKDYPGEKVSPPDPAPRNWFDDPQYRTHMEKWQELRKLAPQRAAK